VIESRSLRIAAATGQIRTMTFKDQEHLVVPVVALMEGVIWPSNSDAPEFVPGEVLASAPAGWNGRPCVGDHPVSGSANDPVTLAREGFGLVFNSFFEDNKLKVEGWLNPADAKPGSVAEEAIRRLRNGETVEVSVGAFVEVEYVTGEYKGKKYNAVWRDIVPDHLAFLSEGSRGACSVDMGCGAPRTAQEHVHLLTAGGVVIQEENMPNTNTPPTPKQRSLRERLFGIRKSDDEFFKDLAGTAEGVSDQAVRDALDRALRSTVPGYAWIEAVFAEEAQVVYAVMPEDALQYLRSKYSLAEDGTAALKGTPEEVKPVTRFEPLTAAEESPAAPAALKHNCTCGAQSAEGAEQMDKKARVTALIARSTNDFTDEDRPMLEAASDTRLAALEAATPTPSPNPLPTPAPTPAPQPPTTTPTPSPTPTPPRTAQEFIASAPADIGEILAEGLRVAQEAKASLVSSLVALGAKCPFTKEQLEAKSMQELRTFAMLASVPAAAPAVVDFSARGIPQSTTENNDAIPPAPSVTQKIVALRAAGSKR
jgi:hypothetical protein